MRGDVEEKGWGSNGRKEEPLSIMEWIDRVESAGDWRVGMEGPNVVRIGKESSPLRKKQS